MQSPSSRCCFFSSRRRHTRYWRDWSSDVCSSDLYWHAGKVDWKVGLLLMPGVFVGGMLGSRLAQRLTPRRMRHVFAVLLFILGAWQALRSEERRVGKEWRARWSPDDKEEKREQWH